MPSSNPTGSVVRGSCLCGSVAYEVRLPFKGFVNCHCSHCRKASGSAYAANAVVDPEAFRWTKGESEIVRYDLPTARSFSVCFCSHCGSQLPHPTRSGQVVILPAGSFDDDPGTAPSANVHWSSRAPWCRQSEGLPTLD